MGSLAWRGKGGGVNRTIAAGWTRGYKTEQGGGHLLLSKVRPLGEEGRERLGGEGDRDARPFEVAARAWCPTLGDSWTGERLVGKVNATRTTTATATTTTTRTPRGVLEQALGGRTEVRGGNWLREAASGGTPLEVLPATLRAGALLGLVPKLASGPLLRSPLRGPSEAGAEPGVGGVADWIRVDYDEVEVIRAESVKRKRRSKMNKHKHRKRKKKAKFKKRKV
ncbi:hypothetical protein HOP50_02g19180 [Chloropicon primus]|uniref:Ribosomal protein mS38 C-terminal domain-containing protein n=1 Tax=Chloropicon primus TaxID=1764295 RepID=A0A5B8MG54_9CHLO|nr:hypothetical protein A3770_02p19210 [Chloropicon primus]UPQ98612.1 hypothetical protein HOP50_02g19180 [Chloropicon primus]|eukprot:QDZ19403.1 hypothetical protein A3770_02p19210 [Chloropicon primus]